MAEPIKNHKVSLQKILNEIAEDEAFSNADRERAKEESLEIEYKEWSARMDELKPKDS